MMTDAYTSSIAIVIADYVEGHVFFPMITFLILIYLGSPAVYTLICDALVFHT